MASPAEMVRTVHLAKQLVRNGTLEGRRYDEPLRRGGARAALPGGGAGGRAVPGRTGWRWRAGCVRRWSARRDGLAGAARRVSRRTRRWCRRVTGRLAAHADSWVDGAGAGDAAAGLPEAYRMAMEVIAREWRVGRGPAGRAAQHRRHRGPAPPVRRHPREPRRARRGDGKTCARPPSCWRDPRVAATVIYRLAQTRTVAQAVAARRRSTRPFVRGPLPEGVSGAAVLGPIRNFQAKLFSAWARAVLGGHPPDDIVDLVEAYGELFPERAQRGAAHLPGDHLSPARSSAGGISRQPEEADGGAGRGGGRSSTTWWPASAACATP